MQSNFIAFCFWHMSLDLLVVWTCDISFLDHLYTKINHETFTNFLYLYLYFISR